MASDNKKRKSQKRSGIVDLVFTFILETLGLVVRFVKNIIT